MTDKTGACFVISKRVVRNSLKMVRNQGVQDKDKTLVFKHALQPSFNRAENVNLSSGQIGRVLPG